MGKEAKISPERPFEGTKIYYSGSMTGAPELDLDFPLQLIQYIEKGGGQILDPHVAIPHKGDEFLAAIAAAHGFTFEEWTGLEQHERDIRIYKHDIELVNEATHVVTLLNGASHGVGMEIQEALRKPQMGLNLTPILGLIHESMVTKLSAMMRGASKLNDQFILRPYSDLSQAQEEINSFLTQ